VLGNHDVNDYDKNSDDPHNLTKSIINELSMNSPVYAMMRSNILFLIVPELGYITWTHPVLYEWIEFMTNQYPDKTTVIFSHQAIEDTTIEDSHEPYRGKQDMDWWATLFQQNPQIKMWIHGHNHKLDWYLGNNSTGETYPVRQFGHEMVFSAPYSHLDWGMYHEEDRVVIYNITSSSISTSTWENNGKGGCWIPDYIHTWNVDTTYDSEAENWYSFPIFLQDNETQITDMKILSPDITLQLVGTEPMELFYDEEMQSPSSKEEIKEIILGFGNDTLENVEWINPGMIVRGPTGLTFPEKYPSINGLQEDGRSGPPYRSFPMGTICTAVPSQTYNFTITARCLSGSGKMTMNVSCSDWGSRSQYSILSSSESQVFSHVFGENFETITGNYTAPNNENVWFLQGNLHFLDSCDYEVSLFSIKRERTSDLTENFSLCLSGSWYNMTGKLDRHETCNFSINPKNLSDSNGLINITAFINGNRYGIANFIFNEPLLMGRNARFTINSYNNSVFNISLVKTISKNSPILALIWKSELFNNFPYLTEIIVRNFIKGISGRILYLFFKEKISGIPPIYKMVPFSDNPIYEEIDFLAYDGSGIKHVSNNQNLWFTCNGPLYVERIIEIYLDKNFL